MVLILIEPSLLTFLRYMHGIIAFVVGIECFIPVILEILRLPTALLIPPPSNHWLVVTFPYIRKINSEQQNAYMAKVLLFQGRTWSCCGGI